MDLTDMISESASSVLLQVINKFASTSCENNKQNEIIAKARRDYSALPDESKELAEEIALLKEILVKQEQTYDAKVKEYEDQIQKMQVQLQQSETQKELLDKQACVESKKDEDLKSIVEKYDETVCKLVNEKLKLEECYNEEIRKIEEEVCKNRETLSESERKFADLHKTYELKKQTRAALEEQQNELKYKIDMSEMALKKNENAYLELEEHAKEQIEKSMQELNNIRQNHLAECTRLKGLARKLDLQIGSLEGMIQQKTRENIELAAIYDDCLNKMAENT